MKSVLLVSSLLIFLSSPAAMLAQLDTSALAMALRTNFESSDLPGLAVAIVTAEGPLYQQAFGYADRDQSIPFLSSTTMPVGSVTKTLTGLAVVKLVQDGVIEWNAPINDYLPFTIENPYFPAEPIRVAQLLNHTSSLQDGKNYGQAYLLDQRADISNKEGMHWGYLEMVQKHDRLSLSEFVEETLSENGRWYKKKNFRKSQPGTEQSYSNINAAVAGLIVERASGKSFASFVQEEIFPALGLTASSFTGKTAFADSRAQLYFPSGYRVPPYELTTYPDGGWLTNLEDLSRYLQDVLGGYQGLPGILNPEGYQLMLPGDGDENRAFWGMGSESRLIGHVGSDPGVHCDIRFSADHPVGIVLLTNTNAEDNEVLWGQVKEILAVLSEAAANVILEE